MNEELSENPAVTNIKDLLSCKKPILLEVRSEYCIHSNIIDKIFQKVENEYNNNISIARIDYETYQELFPDLVLESFPTVLLLKGCKLIKIVNGALSRSNLHNLINELMESHLKSIKKN